MKPLYHRRITTEALQDIFAPDALKTIIAANLGQDALIYQVGHDHFHFDNNAFAAAHAYIEELHNEVVARIQANQPRLARQTFGRLTHTAQDLYAHSNYIWLWREQFPSLPPAEINPELPEILQHPGLHSGKLYYPLEILSFFPLFAPRVLPGLPRDSHAWMNMDDPSRPGFEYAFSAAVKRTHLEYLKIMRRLKPWQTTLFTG